MIFNKSLIALAFCAAPAFAKKDNLRVKTRTLSNFVTVDGNLDDWNLDADFAHDMYNAGYEVAAKTYAEWNCSTNTLCLLVLAEGDNTLDTSKGNTWVKHYTNSGKSSLYYPDVAWIQADCGATIGWEGCFAYNEDGDQLEIHSAQQDGSAVTTDLMRLDLTCADGATTGCGADGICATKDDTVEQKRRKLANDPCVLYPKKNWHGYPGWKGKKVTKPGCDDDAEEPVKPEPEKPEEPEQKCKCDFTYEELQATGICKGKQIPICHFTGETICVAIRGWENGHCPQHEEDFCGACPNDLSGNGENAEKKNGKN